VIDRKTKHWSFVQYSELRLDVRYESHAIVKITVLCRLWKVQFSQER
jgi:hypothetical protein